MEKGQTRKKRNKRTLGENDLKYLTFIDELRKNIRLDSPTAEISRMYKELVDILIEAFDEYEPSDLPKYQDRIDYMIELAEDEPALSDPLFKEDLQKAKSLLDAKVKERWGFFEKLKHVGSVFARNVGGLTAIGQEAIDLYDRASNIGSKFGNLGESVRRKVDDEERRRVQDLIKGNEGQYGSALPASQQGSGALATTNKNIVPVKDDKLIGTNTTQNKVLNNLLVVSRDTNKDIKEIKKLLNTQEQRNDEQLDDASLDFLEQKQEQEQAGPLVDAKNKNALLSSMLGSLALPGGGPSESGQTSAGPSQPEGSGGFGVGDIAKEAATIAVEGWAATKVGSVLKNGWNLLRGARTAANVAGAAEAATGTAAAAGGGGALAGIGATLGQGAIAAASSPVALAGAGAAAGAGLAYLTVPPAMKGVRSLAATIGEKRKGINYYKDVFKYELDDEAREKAENWALQYLFKEAKSKQDLFKSAFQDGSAQGDGSYTINGKPVKRDEAQKDVQSAVDMYNQYNEYLQEKGKKGGLTATATFQGSNGKVYSNPLYKKDEAPPPVPGQVEVAPVQKASEFVSSEKNVSDKTDSSAASPGTQNQQGVIENPTVDQNREVLSNLKKNKASLEKNYNAKIGEALKKGDAKEAQRLSDARDEAVKKFTEESISPLEKRIAEQNKEARKAKEKAQLQETEEVLKKRLERDYGPIPEELKNKSAKEIQDVMNQKTAEEYKAKQQNQLQEGEAYLKRKLERDYGPIPEELKDKSAKEIQEAMVKKTGEEYKAKQQGQLQETESVLKKRLERDYGPIPEELKGKSAKEIQDAMVKKTGEEYKAKQQKQVQETNEILSQREKGTKTKLEHFGPMKRISMNESERIQAKIKEDILSKPSHRADSDTEAVMRGITAAETGAITDKKPIDDPSRFIRTKGGANSSAYGPQQITMSLAKDAASQGMFNDDPELKKWVEDKFVPQGKKFLNADYTDKKYGAGGEGDLNTTEDRQMYMKMSERLIGDTVKRNKGDLKDSLGEWRFGSGKKNQLMKQDPQYAKKAKSQIDKDSVMLAKNEEGPVLLARNDVEMQPRGQDSVQNAVSRLSRDGDASRGQPIVISQNTTAPPQPAPQERTSVSTKQVGAPSNGVAESSFILALRQTLSPIG